MAIKPNWGKGSTSGLRYWIYFMIGLFLLGYSWVLSIGFGAIVAVSVAIIAAWWNAKDDLMPDKPEEKKEEETAVVTPTKRERFRRTGGLGRLRRIRGSSPFSWFRRKR